MCIRDRCKVEATSFSSQLAELDLGLEESHFSDIQSISKDVATELVKALAANLINTKNKESDDRKKQEKVKKDVVEAAANLPA
eukprot:10823447-Karenia_brevis.AAC.1